MHQSKRNYLWILQTVLRQRETAETSMYWKYTQIYMCKNKQGEFGAKITPTNCTAQQNLHIHTVMVINDTCIHRNPGFISACVFPAILCINMWVAIFPLNNLLFLITCFSLYLWCWKNGLSKPNLIIHADKLKLFQ